MQLEVETANRLIERVRFTVYINCCSNNPDGTKKKVLIIEDNRSRGSVETSRRVNSRLGEEQN